MIDSGMCISPGFDFERSVTAIMPMADRGVLLRMKSFFLFRNKEILRDQPGFDYLCNAQSLREWHQHMFLFAGDASVRDYFDRHNPAIVLNDIRVPILYVNARDVR